MSYKKEGRMILATKSQTAMRWGKASNQQGHRPAAMARKQRILRRIQALSDRKDVGEGMRALTCNGKAI
jgi:hypothetical protein